MTNAGIHGSVNESDGQDMVNNAYRRKPAPKSDYVLEQFEFTYPAAWAPYEVRKKIQAITKKPGHNTTESEA